MSKTVFYRGVHVAQSSPLYPLLTGPKSGAVSKAIDKAYTDTRNNFYKLYGEENAKGLEQMALEFHLKTQPKTETKETT